MIKPKFFQIITLCMLSILIANCGGAGAIGTIPGSAAMAFTGKQILDQADRIFDDKLHQANQMANGLVNHFLTGLSALSEGARINLKDVLDKPLGEMKDFQRQLFINIKELSDRLEKIAVTEMYKLEEVANIDLAQRIGDLFFQKDQVFISSIHGLSLCSWKPRHTITMLATGLGPGEAGKKAEVTFFIKTDQGNIELKPDEIDLSKHNQGVYTFAKSKFDKFFSTDSVKTLDLMTRLTVKKKVLFGTKIKTVESHIVLTLYPQQAGKITVEYTAPIYGWGFIERKTEQFRTADCGGGRCGGGGRVESRTTTRVPVGEQSSSPPLGARKVENPGITCGAPWWDPAGCRYVYDLSARVNPTKEFVTALWRVTGVWVTMHVSYDIYEWKKIREEPRKVTLNLIYDKNVDFCLPNGVEYYKITGELLTNDRFELVTGQSYGNVFQYNGGYGCEANGKRHSYKVVRPM